jgi:hypothetical protein
MRTNYEINIEYPGEDVLVESCDRTSVTSPKMFTFRNHCQFLIGNDIDKAFVYFGISQASQVLSSLRTPYII